MYSATWAAKRAAMLWAAKYPMRAANVQQKTCSKIRAACCCPFQMYCCTFFCTLQFLIQPLDWCNLFAFNTRAGSPGLSKGCDSAVWGEAESQPLGRVGRARAYPEVQPSRAAKSSSGQQNTLHLLHVFAARVLPVFAARVLPACLLHVWAAR